MRALVKKLSPFLFDPFFFGAVVKSVNRIEEDGTTTRIQEDGATRVTEGA